jgi:hypothetical protein
MPGTAPPASLALRPNRTRISACASIKCAARDKPVTITGALIHLGLSSRTSLLDYEGREGFSEPVKRLRLQVENAYESRLHGNSPTGAIFALKNMGWEDRSQREISGADNGPLVVMWGGKE